MFLFTGMTLCLIAYTIYPTGVYFRPNLDSLSKDNVLINLTRVIYSVDPGTNVCPSIHCFNSIGIAIAVLKCSRLNKNKFLVIGSITLSTLICMSTMFVKQHSIIDFYYAVGLSILMYVLAYVPKYNRLFSKLRNPEVIIPIAQGNKTYVISKE
jgi:membrane-associated phospholipid phosphatase